MDYLELAISQLKSNASFYKFDKHINTYISAVEQYKIKKDYYDLIIAHGILVYLESEKAIKKTIIDMINGTKKGGINYISINTDISDTEIETKKVIKPLVENILKSTKMIMLLKKLYKDWRIEVLKEIPYKEFYERKGIKLEYTCKFILFLGEKV